jgi:sulfoxide reductase heme-binding subunit YedZ
MTLLGALGTAGVSLLAKASPLSHRLSLGTAYVALVLLAISLAIGPFNLMLRGSSPVSTYLRRDVGIFASLFALLHVIFGLQVHLAGDIVRYFYDSGASRLRYDLFGIANHAGLLCTLVLLMLLSLSNNLSIRYLTARRWKTIQRSNYLVALLVILHGTLYMLIEHRRPILVGTFVVISVSAAFVQFLGFQRWRQNDEKFPRAFE